MRQRSLEIRPAHPREFLKVLLGRRIFGLEEMICEEVVQTPVHDDEGTVRYRICAEVDFTT
jgi:hypothetical protein